MHGDQEAEGQKVKV